ncbi:MAG: deoxynucleoside kinase [Proteobacteria bacterium]|nr:deoxynucleoside kinase [Pseudomonadota bacterium]
MAARYIAVAGNMGSGKSSLVKFLCEHFGLKPFFEPNDQNPFLPLFFRDMKRWAFHSQMHFLTHKFRIHRELDSYPGTVVQDRTIYEDAEIFEANLFRQGSLTREEHRTYRDLYEAMLGVINPPDLLIYLECPLPVLKKRIAGRGRTMERGVPDGYLRRLERCYRRWLARYDRSPILVISSAEKNYLEDFIDRQGLLEEVGRHL